jgi:hypothetical protein
VSGSRSDPLVVSLPEPTGRRLRLGPFPSAREALKFVTYAAIGGVVAGLVTPAAWIPFVGGGFVFATYQPDGRGLDRLFADYCRWRWRSRWGGAPGPSARVRGGVMRIEGGPCFAVLAAGGTPVAFLPPDDARRRFQRYREMLRALDHGAFLRVGVEPIPAGPFVGPTASGADAAEREARAGYQALVRLLCRRRSVRRVDVYLAARVGDGEPIARLEAQVSAVRIALGELGVAVRRLRGAELETAIRRLGFESPSGAAT